MDSDKNKLIITSGYFNPLHVGHLEYFELSKKIGDKLLVIVNNDTQRKLKGSKEFFNEKDRCKIIDSLRIVDYVFLSIDSDRSVIKSLGKIHGIFKSKFDLYFTNGGDQFFDKSPENDICDKLGIVKVDNLGRKIQSSSWLISKIDDE